MEIKIRNLRKCYGKHELFSNLNLKITSGKINCLYGTSGCGKTTILDIIGFIEPYQGGDIFYNGKKIVKSAQKRKMLREKVGFIFQDFGLIENETVAQNFNMVYKIKRMKNREKRIQSTLKKLQLENMLNRKVYELSGGEQQRIAIAKVLLKNPDLILADEPTASLDVENKQIVLNMMREFANAGKTVVVVSHDPEIIEFSDVKLDLAHLKRKTRNEGRA
ncbi:ATP-binding cassette domain-containing protein [Holdemania massiliensis]|uniref:ATP-binding cassette domain-containing protein n=1 Tax=Holdemania massiliensis TaxID=1468449 RepID=UPI001F060AC6|nr:ATP-binding cassette domain-containing protein [Holdemania massiliensis]MCH1939361.1 ATP-binding cassette domain-containing protein [Holdemania massiliensis]